MKKITLLVASILLVGSVANASEIIKFSDERSFTTNFSDAEPITFMERGIEFYIFPDGQFDFNTEPTTGSDAYYKSGKRSSSANTNLTYGAPGANYNQGVRIEHDSQGRIRRIGNVFVNYDAGNRIKRIGSVYMTYNRFALSQVGGMQIVYNRRGQIIDMIGSVKGSTYTNGGNYYYGSSNANNTNNDSYYYRADGTKTADKKEK